MSSILKVDTIQDASGNAIISSDGSGNLTPNTFTALTVSGDLTVDTDTLKVDSTNNRVGVGTSSPDDTLHVNSGSLNDVAKFESTDTTASLILVDSATTTDGNRIQTIGDTMNFQTAGSESMRIDSNGNVLVGKIAQSSSVVGCELNKLGLGAFTRSDNLPLIVNRTTSDGQLVSFRQDGTAEGNISVSGTTVSYNGFTGTHWSRLSDNSKPTILKGTILESLDEMMDWYQIQFDITEIDDEGNETTRIQKERYALGDGENVGDVITYNYEGADYQATIIQEDDIKHTKSKISDTVDAKNVYGVFVAWDNDDDTVNDMYVAQTGSYVIRINGSETVSKGDLIQSNGDGTGKVQSDDIIRASTVAKVISSTKVETYDDGSYIVPCTLHC